MTGVPEDLYETDYYRWVKTQVAELRRMRRDRINTALDLERLADEVNDLGKSERDACRSQVRRIIEHLLKLQYSPATLPRGAWQASVAEARATLADKLTPSLRRDLRTRLPELYAAGRRIAEAALRDYGELDARAELPASSPYTLAQILAPDWLPPEPSASGPVSRPDNRRSRA
jgi:hypothetical protein